MNWKHIACAAAALAALVGSSAFTSNIAEAHRRGHYFYGGGFGDPFYYRTPHYYDAPYAAPYDDTPYYDGGDCAWLQRNAVTTGMRLWKDRYQECLRYRKK
jgi:hypothetical protein